MCGGITLSIISFNLICVKKLWNLLLFPFGFFPNYYDSVFLDLHLNMSVHVYALSGKGQSRMTDTLFIIIIVKHFNLISSISVFRWTTRPFPLEWQAIEMCRSTCLSHLHYPSPVKGWINQIALYLDAVHSVLHSFRALSHIPSFRAFLSICLNVSEIICCSDFLFCIKDWLETVTLLNKK